jgi:hypothetical protein
MKLYDFAGSAGHAGILEFAGRTGSDADLRLFKKESLRRNANK